MTKHIPMTAALALLAVPALAQPKPLTPPAVFAKAKTIQLTATVATPGGGGEVSRAALALPNKAYVVDTNIQTGKIDTVYASDGKTQTEYTPALERYTQTSASARLSKIESHTVAFSVLSDFLEAKAFALFKHSPSDKPGVYSRVLRIEGRKTFAEVLNINPSTGLPTAISVTSTPSGYPTKVLEKIVFSGWKLNAPISSTKFAYAPPADAALYVEPKLLAKGVLAPNFTVSDRKGNPVSLSSYRGKTVVLDFWATWCGPCQMSLPHTSAVAWKYRKRNVVVLAVNVWDTPAAFQQWLPEHKAFSDLKFARDPNPNQDKSVATALYGVSGIPTQYVISAQGRVIKSIVGYDTGDKELETTLNYAARSATVAAR